VREGNGGREKEPMARERERDSNFWRKKFF